MVKRLPCTTGAWAPPAKQHTKNSYSGWSKRATRGYQSDYDDRSRQWEDNKPGGSTKDKEGVIEVTTVAEVEVAENNDKCYGRVATDNAASTAPADTTWDSATAMTTEKEAVRTRLGELDRLLNYRKGTLGATYKMNSEANDRAYDMNQKTMQALDTLAEENGTFEAP